MERALVLANVFGSRPRSHRDSVPNQQQNKITRLIDTTISRQNRAVASSQTHSTPLLQLAPGNGRQMY